MDYSSINTLNSINMKDFDFLEDNNKLKSLLNGNKRSTVKGISNISIFNNNKHKINKNSILKQKEYIPKKDKNKLTQSKTTKDNTINSLNSENTVKNKKYEKFLNNKNIEESQESNNKKPKPILNKENKFLMKVILNHNLNKKSYYKDEKKDLLNMSDYKIKENKINLGDLLKYIFSIEKKLKDNEESLYKKGLKEFMKKIDNLIARYSLIIFILIKNKEKEEAKNIFLLMLKENLVYINYIEQNIFYHYYVSKENPIEAYELLRIYSFIIKYSRFFNMTNYCTIFIGRYLELIYFIYNLLYYKSHSRGFTLDTKNQINLWFSLALHNISYYVVLNYFPLNISISLNNNIISMYQSSDNYLSKKEKSLLIKVAYNSSLFCYLNGQSDKAIFYLNDTKERILLNEEDSYNNSSHHIKKKKQSMNLFPNSTNNKDFFYNEEDVRLSTATSISEYVKNKTKNKNDYEHKLTNIDKIKETFSKDKINLDDIHLLINYSLENGLIDEIKSSRYIQKNFISPTNITSKLKLTKKLTIPKHYKHPLLFKLELLYSEIELDKKNFTLAYEHILKALYILLLLKLNIDGNGFLSFNEEQKIIERYLILLDKLKEKETENKGGKSESEEKSNSETESENESVESSKNNSSEKSKKKSKKKKYKEDSEDIILNKYNLFFELFKENEKDKKEKVFLFCSQKDINYKVLQDIEKFFIFLCSLSLYQISILNNTQPENKKGNDLPLLFSTQFKDCLSNNQRKELNNLQTMAFNRCLILKNPDDWIIPNNLNIDLINEKKMEKLKRKKTFRFINKYNEENMNENQLRQTQEYKIYQKILISGKMTKEIRDFLVKNIKIVLKILKNLEDNDIEKIIESPIILIKPVKQYKKNNKKSLEKNYISNINPPLLSHNSLGLSTKKVSYRVSLTGAGMLKTKLRLQKNLDLKKENNSKYQNYDDFFERLSGKKYMKKNSKLGQILIKEINEYKPNQKDNNDYDDNYKDIGLSLNSTINNNI